MRVTKLEMQVINDIVNADHSSDGFGLGGYLYHDEYDMKVFRGVFASLSKKGIAHFEETDLEGDRISDPSTWGSICSAYQEEVEKSSDQSQYTESEKNTIKWTGFRLINIITEGGE